MEPMRTVIARPRLARGLERGGTRTLSAQIAELLISDIRTLVRLLVDHPAVRGARRMCLGTKDAHAVYRPFGFVDVAALPPRPYLSTMMVRVRPRLEPLAKTT